MKKLIYFMLILVVCCISFGCKTKYIHVPVETIKTEKEYIDRWQKDSIHVHDSIFLTQKGDTIYFEKYKTVYKDRMVKDSIFITDSIKVEIPYPVEVTKEVNRLEKWQIILMVLGGVLIGYIAFRIIRKIKI